MFDLQVEEYCSNCHDFEVVCENFSYDDFDLTVRVDHIISCKHRNKCKKIKEYLNREMGVME